MLETPRRGIGGQLSVAAAHHCERGGTYRPAIDAGDKGVIRKSKSRVVTDADEFVVTSNAGHLCADIDVSVASCYGSAGLVTDSDVRITGGE